MGNILVDLPDHTEELKAIEDIINRTRIKIDNDITDGKMTTGKIQLYEFTLNEVLYRLGELSISRFDIRDSLEEQYFKLYKKQPKLSKKLWLDHYEGLHKPYDKLKNKCFTLFKKIMVDSGQ